MKTLGFPAKMSKSGPSFRRTAPTLGQHSEIILKELLYTDEEIAEIKKHSII